MRPSADSADGGAPVDLSADLSPQNICARLFWPDSISVISAASTAATTPSSASASRGVAPSSSSSFCVGVSSTCARAQRKRGEGARKLDSRDASPSTTHEARALTSSSDASYDASGPSDAAASTSSSGASFAHGQRARNIFFAFSQPALFSSLSNGKLMKATYTRSASATTEMGSQHVPGRSRTSGTSSHTSSSTHGTNASSSSVASAVVALVALVALVMVALVMF